MNSFYFALGLHYLCPQTTPRIMTIKEFFSFKQNKFFWINLIAMVIVVALVLFGVLKGLDIYTRHGEAVVVPNVKGMGVAEAEKMFRNQGLTCIVSDSSYVKNLPAGCILEHNPAAGQKVKEGDTVVILEAMKMQNNIEAEISGTITEIHVSQGDTVMEGKPLVTIC